MSVRGWVTGCALVNQGSELVADAAVGATTLTVDWVGDFDDTGGTLRLNDVELDYTTVDTVADTLTLAAPLAVAAATGDRVDAVVGGQVLKDYTLYVTIGEGDDIEVDIPFGDRDAWPEGEYDDPVEVLLSKDQESIESVPGRGPVRTLIGTTIIGGSIHTGDDTVGDGVHLTGDSLAVSSGGRVIFATSAEILLGNPGRVEGYLTVTGALDAAVVTSSGNVIASGALKADSLAIGGANDTDFGARYCRVGPDGKLFASTMAPSSASVKHDINDLDLDVDAVLAMRPVTYRYNEMPDVVRVGLIAEEVDDLGLHALVGYEDRDHPTRPTGLDYDGLGAALLLVVQRQQQQIADLAARVEQLEANR